MIKVVRQGNGYRIERHRTASKNVEIYSRDGRWSTNYNGTLYFADEFTANSRANVLRRSEIDE